MSLRSPSRLHKIKIQSSIFYLLKLFVVGIISENFISPWASNRAQISLFVFLHTSWCLDKRKHLKDLMKINHIQNAQVQITICVFALCWNIIHRALDKQLLSTKKYIFLISPLKCILRYSLEVPHCGTSCYNTRPVTRQDSLPELALKILIIECVRVCVCVCVCGGGGGGGWWWWEGGRHGTGYNFGWTSSIAAICIPNINSMIWKVAE